jgi:Holliday junction resolvasome RuvABC endonuclease subunit
MKYHRILAIAPSTRGFGFAVFEGQDSLADWGVKYVAGDKNANSVAKVKDLIILYQPDVLVLEDTKDSRRSSRIKALNRKVVALAASCKLRVALFSQEQVRRAFFADGEGTKYAVAEIIAKEFPEELASRLPPKRRPWTSEDSRMNIFDAVALSLVLRLSRAKR